MPSLKLKDVPDPIGNQVTVVDVSAWLGYADKEEKDPFTVTVRPLTVAKKNTLQSIANRFEKSIDAKTGEETYHMIPNLEHDSSCIIAALCCYDDDGNLTFGVDEQDAVKRVEGLDKEYRPMIIKLSSIALKGTENLNSKAAVKEAQKN